MTAEAREPNSALERFFFFFQNGKHQISVQPASEFNCATYGLRKIFQHVHSLVLSIYIVQASPQFSCNNSFVIFGSVQQAGHLS